jgi:hypothetical protein
VERGGDGFILQVIFERGLEQPSGVSIRTFLCYSSGRDGLILQVIFERGLEQPSGVSIRSVRYS